MKYPAIVLTALFASLPVADATSQTKRSGCFPQKHAKVPSVVGSSYSLARRALLRAGWQPADFRPDHSNADMLFGNTENALQLGWQEVEDCSGTGLGYCHFLFSDVYRNKLVVITSGELELKGKKLVSDITVESVGFDCE